MGMERGFLCQTNDKKHRGLLVRKRFHFHGAVLWLCSGFALSPSSILLWSRVGIVPNLFAGRSPLVEYLYYQCAAAQGYGKGPVSSTARSVAQNREGK